MGGRLEPLTGLYQPSAHSVEGRPPDGRSGSTRRVGPEDYRLTSGSNQPAVRPPAFDLPAYWTEWCARFGRTLPQYQVTLRTRPDFLPELHRRLWRLGQPLIPSDAAGLAA